MPVADAELARVDAALSRAKSTAEGRVRMAIFSAAVQQVNSRGSSPSAASVAAAIVAGLDGASLDDSNTVAAMFFLLSLLLPSLSDAVLRQHADAVSRRVTQALAKHAQQVPVLRWACPVLARLLICQPASAWRGEEMSPAVNFLLTHALHAQPKARHAATSSIASLLLDACAAARRRVAKQASALATSVLKDEGSVSSHAYAIDVAKLALPCMSVKRATPLLLLVASFAAASGGPGAASVAAIATALGVRDSFEDDTEKEAKTVSEETATEFGVETLRAVLDALARARPPATAIDLVRMWLTAVVVAAARLIKRDSKALALLTPAIIESLADYFSSSAGAAVWDAASQNLSKIGDLCVGKASGTGDRQVVEALRAIVHPRNRASWHVSLPAVAVCVRALGKDTNMIDLIGDVGMIHRAAKDNMVSVRNHVLDVLSAAMVATSPETVVSKLTIVDPPLPGTAAIRSLKNTWLLFAFSRPGAPPCASFFMRHLLPMHDGLEAGAKAADAERLHVEAKNLRGIASQVWEAAKSCLTGPISELTSALPTIVPRLTQMASSEGGRNTACAVLKAISEALGSSGGVVAVFEQNAALVLQPLIQAAEAAGSSEDRAPLLVTVTSVCKIISPTTVTRYLKLALKSMLTHQANEDGDAVDAYLDILVSLVQGGGAVDAAVSSAAVAGVQNMVTNGAPPQQKRAYKALCALMQGDLQADASSNIINLVMSTVGSVSAAARPARLRAISLVLKHKAVEIVTNGSLVSRLLGEVMLSCKDPSKKTRDAAFEALVSVAKASEVAGGSTTRGLEVFLGIMMAGFAGNTSSMISATVVSLGRILFEYGELCFTVCPQLLETVGLLLKHRAREVVGAAVGFIKVAVVKLPAEMIDSFLPALIPALTGWSTEARRRFRTRIRTVFDKLMRKFGEERLSALVPPEHFKFWSHLVKTRRRDRRKVQEARLLGKSKPEGNDEDGLDDLFGDVGSDDGSESSDDSDVDDLANTAATRKPSRGVPSGSNPSGDMGDGVTLHEGRFIVQEQGGTVGRSRKDVAADARHILSEAAVGLSAKDMASDSEDEKEVAPQSRKRGRGGRDDFGTEVGEEGQWGMSFKEKMRAKKYKKKGVVVQDGSMFQAPRAGGDLSRPNQRAPFAYVPLDKSAMKNKRDLNVRKAFAKLGSKGGGKR